jgi:hypothetical protein
MHQHVPRQERTRQEPPRSVPWALEADTDVVAMDTTWGELQGLEAAPGVRTVGELELVELDPGRLSILFRNGPQCPQSPHAIRRLLDAGYPAGALAYYRGGMHDWVTLAMPTEPRED